MNKPIVPRFGPPPGFSLAAHHAKFDDVIGRPVCGPANHRLYKAREALRATQERIKP